MDLSATVRRVTERRNRDDEILAAAIDVFARYGYSGSSLQDVADAVGILKGSLYHYIDSKERLLFRIFDMAHSQAVELMAEVDAENLPPREKLQQYVRRLVLWYLSRRSRSIVYFTEWRYLTGEFGEEVRRQRREFEGYMRSILQAAADEGGIAPGTDLRITSFSILAAVNAVPTWYNETGPDSPEFIADRVAEIAARAAFGS